MAITLKELQELLSIEDVNMGGGQYGMPSNPPISTISPVGTPLSQSGIMQGSTSGAQPGTYIPGITPAPIYRGGNGMSDTGLNDIGYGPDRFSGFAGLSTGDFFNAKNLGLMALGINPVNIATGVVANAGIGGLWDNITNQYTNAFGGLNQATKDAIDRENASMADRGQAGKSGKDSTGYDSGNECFEPNTLIQMTDGSEKKIKDIELGDDTKGGKVTGVFQFKFSGDVIYNYKGVTVAGSHFVKEDGKFIMVKDSPLAIKIDKIPVVYSLDTTGRRIFINDIEFADYNGDGVAKSFLSNAGVDLSGFDKEVLRQVENRLI